MATADDVWQIQLAKFLRALTELVNMGKEVLKKELEKKASR